MLNIKKILLLLFIFMILFLSVSSQAEMKSMDEDELSQVTAQAGVTAYMDTRVSYSADNIKYSDSNTTSPNWIEFQGFSIDDGNGNPFAITVRPEDPIVIDVATDTSGRSYVDLNLSQYYEQPRYYHIDSLVFCGQRLGRLDIEGVSQSSYHLRMGNHSNGSSGFDFDYSTKLDIDRINFTYNNNNESLIFDGIHFSKTASGNPEDPSSWSHNGDFKIGNLEDNPATFDVATTDTGETGIFMNLPMEGSIRVNDVSLGGTSFGPVAIDGINVHRMSVVFSGN